MPKSLYAIVLSLTLAGMIVVGVIGGMIIHFTRSGGEKVHTEAQVESAELAQTAQITQTTQPVQTTTSAPQPSGGAAYLVFILPDNYFYMDNSGNMHNVQ